MNETYQQLAELTKYGRAYRYASEAPEQPHGGQRRENHQRRDQKRAHQIHGKDDDDRNNDRNQQVIGVCLCPGRRSEFFIEGHGEYFVVKQ